MTNSEPDATPGLTDDDLVMLKLLADDRSHGEIAELLGMSNPEVERRLGDIRAYFGVRTEMQAVVEAIRLGLIGPGVSRSTD